MPSLTICCDDTEPMYSALVEVLARYGARHRPETTNERAGVGPTTKSTSREAQDSKLFGSPEKRAVEWLWEHSGQGSRRLIWSVAQWCDKSKMLSFTLDDIADISDLTKADLKANNRNLNRTMKKENIRLWDTRWDPSKRRMNFVIRSQEYLEAILETAVPAN